MIKFVGNDVWRDGEKVGWIEGNHVYAKDGKKLGYFADNLIYDENADKVAYIEGDYLMSYGSDIKTPLDKVSEAMEGGVLPELDKCAVYVLLGS